MNLGKMPGSGNRRDEALNEYAEALRLNPQAANAHYDANNLLRKEKPRRQRSTLLKRCG